MCFKKEKKKYLKYKNMLIYEKRNLFFNYNVLLNNLFNKFYINIVL